MIIFVFLLCEPGERMTTQFNELNDELNRCDWYLLPISIQQMYVIFSLEAQNSMEMLSYADITCERQT